MTEKMKKLVPDTSILIRGTLSELAKKGELKNTKIIIPKAALDELQAQASKGRDIGFRGLDEIKTLKKMSKKGIEITFSGTRPTPEEIRLAKSGRIDAIIRDVAAKEEAKLITGDYVQALVGEAEGVEVEHIPVKVKKKLTLESFFDKNTQSVHLKTDVVPMAKVGKPGAVKLKKLKKKPMEGDAIKSIIEEVLSKSRHQKDAFIEMNSGGSMVVQMGEYRVSISKPPFSEDLELTAVRPIADVTLNDYALHEKLKTRIINTAQGILISGSPGSGKSSFAGALAKFLSKQGKVVKTFEQPRDLQVGPEITQYSPLNGSWSKTSEVLLLVRPDYTIFDEIRRTKDFMVFGDMRMAGVGMIGVVHSTSPVSAIQRFIGRLELGMIPNIVDTVIFIEGGKISKVLELSLIVKIPSGMQEADLARPVVEIRDFATKTLEYEIYAYGNENVIITVEEEKKSPLRSLAKKQIMKVIKRFDKNAEIEFLDSNRVSVKVSNKVIPRLIGKKGSNIDKIEKKLGINISVEPKD